MTDLTNTTWIINLSPVYDQTTLIQVNFTSNGNSYTQFGYVETPLGYAIIYDSTQVFLSARPSPAPTPEPVEYGWVSEAYRTVTFANDPLSPVFTTWLENNAVQVVTNKKAIKFNNKYLSKVNNSYLDKINGESVQCFEKVSSSLITFKITQVVAQPMEPLVLTYQAEQGMTWAEWVASAYNTDGWGIEPNRDAIINTSLSAHLLQVNNEISTNTISSNGAYTFSMLGGGAD